MANPTKPSRRARRVFVEPEALSQAIDGGRLELERAQAHHLLHVLRRAEGDQVEVFDGLGRIARGTLLTPPDARAFVDQLEVATVDTELPPLVVAQALCRPSKLEEVVRRSTELGASAVWLFDAHRSQHKPLGEGRLTRLERVALDAARQSERATTLDLEQLDHGALFERVQASEAIWVTGVLGAESPLWEVLSEAPSDLARRGMVVVVGPEGGLDEAEVAQLAAGGAQPVALGPHVLRTETAGLVGLAVALAVLGKA